MKVESIGFRIRGLGFGVWGLGFGVSVLGRGSSFGFRVSVVGFPVFDSGFRIRGKGVTFNFGTWGSRCRVKGEGLGFRVWDSGVGFQGSGLRVSWRDVRRSVHTQMDTTSAWSRSRSSGLHPAVKPRRLLLTCPTKELLGTNNHINGPKTKIKSTTSINGPTNQYRET